MHIALAAMLAASSVAGPVTLPAQSGTRAGGARGSAASETVAIVGATVVDVVTGERRVGQVVVIAEGRIRQLLQAGAPLPRGARVIRMSGRFIIPGLWDMHVEQALPLWDRSPVDSNAALFHPLFLAHGVTGVRDVAGPVAVVQRWREAIERGTREGPRIVYTGPKLGMDPVGPGTVARPSSPSELDAALASLAASGATAAYLYDLPAALLPSLGNGVARHKLRLEGNVPLGSTLRRQVNSGQRVVEHLDGVLLACSSDEESVRRTLRLLEDPTWWARAAWSLGIMHRPEYPTALALESFVASRLDSLVRLLAEQRVFQVPTLRMLGVLNRSADSAVRLPPAPLELRPPRRPWRGWASEPHPPAHPLARTNARLLEIVGAMARAGVPILAGSDTPNLYAAPGLSLHDELELLVRAGLTPLQALQGATWRPAQLLEATDSLGVVAQGRVADLVVLSADPTIDIRNTRRIELVVARGKVYDAAALTELRLRGELVAREIESYWMARQEKSP